MSSFVAYPRIYICCTSSLLPSFLLCNCLCITKIITGVIKNVLQFTETNIFKSRIIDRLRIKYKRITMNNETSKPGALSKTLILRATPDILDYIELCAEKQGLSKSIIARQLLEIGKLHYKTYIK